MSLTNAVSYLNKNILFFLSRQINYPLVNPDMTQINFTYRCNLRCSMCSMNETMLKQKREGKQIELDNEAIRKVIKDSKEMGVKNILFIGGEPLLRKELFDFVEYAKSLDLNTVIVTNGTLLDRYMKKIISSKVDCLSISVDAAREETFSKIRGNKVFSKIMKNIDKIKKKNSPILIAVCTIMNQNVEELIDIVRLCKKKGFSKILFQPVIFDNTDQAKDKSISFNKEKQKILEKQIENLINYKKNEGFIGNSIKNLRDIKKYFKGELNKANCYAGYNRIQVVQDGKIYFCVNQNKYEATFGDIKKQSLKELWFSKKAKEYRKIIKSCKTPCLQLCSTREEFFYFDDLKERALSL